LPDLGLAIYLFTLKFQVELVRPSLSSYQIQDILEYAQSDLMKSKFTRATELKAFLMLSQMAGFSEDVHL
jgi:hypothetical protein